MHNGMSLMCSIIFFTSLIFTGNSAQAADERHQLYVLLVTDSGAPTSHDVVENWDFTSTAPTPGLDAGSPVSAWYLLPFRADGKFRARLKADPDSPRARLERWIVVEYSAEADRTIALAALEADANVEAVSEPVTLETSAASSSGWSGAGTDNYGWSTMSVGQAWQRAGGHALVGVADSGLATNHPELRAFTPSGVFTRGNFLEALSADVGRWPDPPDLNVDEREPEFIGTGTVCSTDAAGMAAPDVVWSWHKCGRPDRC